MDDVTIDQKPQGGSCPITGDNCTNYDGGSCCSPGKTTYTKPEEEES